MAKRSIRSARRAHRNARGSGIVEGICGLGLVIGGVVLATLLIVNTGMAMYLKGKLAFVAQQTARFSTGLPQSTMEKDAEEFGKELARRMGLDPKETQIKIARTSIGSSEAIEAQASSSMTTFGNVDWLPKTVGMTDSAIAITNDGASDSYGYLAVSVTGAPDSPGSEHVYLPVVKPKLRGAMSTSAPGGVATTNIAKPVSYLNIQDISQQTTQYARAKGELTAFSPFSQQSTPMGNGQWLNPGQNTMPTLH